MAVVSLNGESELAEALLDFYSRLRRVSSVSSGSGAGWAFFQSSERRESKMARHDMRPLAHRRSLRDLQD